MDARVEHIFEGFTGVQTVHAAVIARVIPLFLSFLIPQPGWAYEVHAAIITRLEIGPVLQALLRSTALTARTRASPFLYVNR